MSELLSTADDISSRLDISNKKSSENEVIEMEITQRENTREKWLENK